MFKQMIVILILYLSVIPLVGGAKKKGGTYKIVVIIPKNAEETQLIIKSGAKHKIDFWVYPSKSLRPVTAMVDDIRDKGFIDSLKGSKIEIKFHGTDSLISIIKKQLKGRTSLRVGDKFDYDNAFHTLDQIYQELDRVVKAHPNRASIVSIGKSFENKDIKAIKLFGNELKEKLIVFECGIHAREWLSQAFCMWALNKLVADHPLLDAYDFLIIPVLNADGYVWSWTDWVSTQDSDTWDLMFGTEWRTRLWRKNREPNPFPQYWKEPEFGKKHYDYQMEYPPAAAKCIGVDLNRNFKTGNFCVFEKSGPNDPCSDQYCGGIADRAVEVKALQEYLTPLKGKIVAYFNFHTYGQEWMYPRSYTTEEQKLSDLALKALTKLHGTEYTSGSGGKILYLASGCSDDWVYDQLGIEVVFSIEMRPKAGSEKISFLGFIQEESQIKPNSEEVFAGVEAVLNQLTQDSKDAPGVEGPAQHLSGSYQVMASVVTILVVLISAYILRFI